MSVIDNLRWILSADGKEFRQEIARSEKTLKRGSRNMDRDLQRLNRGFASMRNLVLGALGIGGLGAFTNSLIKTADETGKLAKQLGTTSEELSTLTFAAEQSGADLNDMRLALRRLSRGIEEAERGTGAYGKKLTELGIQTKDANGQMRSSTDVLADVADLFQTLPDGPTKTALAFELLGDNGQRLIPLLNEGSAGMRKLQDRARDLGLEIGTDTAEAAARFSDQLHELRSEARGFGNDILVDALPFMNEFITTVRFAREESGGLMAAWVALGGVGEAVFGSSLQQKINETSQQITKLEETLAKPRRFFLEASDESISAEIEKLKNSLAELEAQKAQQEENEKRRRAEAKKRLEEEQEQRLKAAEALRKEQAARAEALRAEEEAAKRIEEGNKAISQLERQIALHGEITRVAEIRFDIENGHYEGLKEAQKQRLIQLAEELDAQERNKKAAEEAAQKAKTHADEMARLGEQVFQATRTEAELLEQEMAKLNELLKAGAIDWETYGRAVKDAKDQQSELTQFGVQAARNMQTAFADFLFDPFDEGVRGMLVSFARVIQRMIAEALAAQALQSLLGLFSAGAGAAGAGAGAAGSAASSGPMLVARGGLIQGFADGGPVRGPGTGTSDSIPARLSNGEFVQPANSTSHYGADFMEAIRRRALPRNAVRGLLDNVDRMRPRVVAAPAFAEGGMPAGGAAAPVSVRTVLVDDRANIGDYLKSSEGEKVLVEFLSRNRSTARRIIGG